MTGPGWLTWPGWPNWMAFLPSLVALASPAREADGGDRLYLDDTLALSATLPWV